MPRAHVSMSDGFKTHISARDHLWHADLSVDEGGDGAGPNPEEMVMGALGSCMGQTAKLYAERKGWQIDRIEIDLDFERFRAGDYDGYEGEARFIHEVREGIIIEGPLTEEQKERVLEIMGKCPVRRLISNPAFFVTFEAKTK